jgi:predicted HAD superfamily hydrolase
VEESPLRSHQQPTILEAMSMLIDVSRIDVFGTQNKINLSRTDVSKVDIEELKEYNQEI